ncbi:MAG: thymidine phosphorylase [Chloroflexi bacterium]|nr:thymidine phosphorylase [Chloroflexota bacterium]
MRAVDIIAKKRDGHTLTRDEIHWFIDAFTHDTLPDYQVAAWLMAVYLQGMNRQETVDLTMALAESGETLDLTEIDGYVVDKHSSGGVGDKTSLVVAPLVASCGVPVIKMSGRGLGFSGGTLDKLEAIAGYDVHLSAERYIALGKQIGIALGGQTESIAPADGKLYALRDVTGTVPSLPLIASSIVSKKIAAGAHGIVLDVKVGRGAFMQTLEAARQLATMMVEIATDAKRNAVALLSDMNQPLGYAVGNALEIAEAVETLRGGGPADLREHCLAVGVEMLHMAGQRGKRRWTTETAARASLEQQIENGAALAKFRELVAAQGGDVSMIDDPARLPQASLVETLTASQDGSIAEVKADAVAVAAFELGAGRERKSDPIDPAVGVKVHVKVGDRVQAGAPLATIYANDAARLAKAKQTLLTACTYSDAPVAPLPLFYRPAIHTD